ncbi:MAG: DotI/IcmL family type IV secretion protein [Proteobacteria bacterium]|nr:DotI/IcmL family type IV secretion protein [Pseudomonadota bacterium]
MKKILIFVTAIWVAVATFTLKAQESGQVTSQSDISKNVTQSNQNTQDVIIWADQIILATFTFNFNNFSQVKGVAQYYSKQAYQSLQEYFRTSHDLEATVQHKFVVTSTLPVQSTLVSEGMVNGIYAWNIKIPLKVVFQSEKELIYQYLLINAQVVNNAASGANPSFLIQDISIKQQMAPFN